MNFGRRRGTEAKIGGWPQSRYSALVSAMTLAMGAVGIALIAFRVPAVFLWALLLVFYIVLAFRVLQQGGRELHLVTVGWLTGLPLGLVFGLVEILSYRDVVFLIDLVRLPIVIALFGVLITTATSFVRHRKITARHFFFGDPSVPKRNHP